MAERNHRMFAKNIIDSDKFLDMGAGARLLYYDLIMRADDDGFVGAPKRIMRETGASLDDMNVLISKSYVLPFDSGVVVIKHWRIHNSIKKDRYKKTEFTDERSMLELNEKNEYEFDDSSNLLPDGTEVEPEWNQIGTKTEPVSKEKIREEKIREEKESKEKKNKEKEERLNRLLEEYHRICVSLPSVRKVEGTRKAHTFKRMDSFSDDDFLACFEKAEASDFLSGRKTNWRASWDWFMANDENILRVLEGNYDNQKKRSGGMGGYEEAIDGKFQWVD